MILSLAFFFALPVSATFSPQECSPGPAPLTELKASYTRGEPLSMTVDPMNRLLFLAEGAEISILGINPLPTPQEYAPVGNVRIPVDCSPIAMALNGEDQLLIAGGSQGLWAVQLCTSLWQTTPVECASYVPFLVNSAAPQALSRKVCHDVVTLTGEGCNIAVALFSAIGANELRCYTLPLTANQTPYKTVPLTYLTATDAIAYSLAADPTEPGAVFVAAGTGGLNRVSGLCPNANTAQYPLEYSTEAPPSLPPTTDQTYPFSSSPGLERVVDVATVMTSQGVGRVYALLDYGRVIGYETSGGIWNTMPLFRVFLAPNELVCARYIDAAILKAPASDPFASKVLISVAAQDAPILLTSHAAPYFVTGRWSAGFGPGIGDANINPVPPPPPSKLAIHAEPSVHVYIDDLLLTNPPSALAGFPMDTDHSWRGVAAKVPAPTSTACRIYELATSGVTVRRIANPQTTPVWTIVWSGTGRVIAPISVMIPRFNPDFPLCSIDSVGPSLPADKRMISTSGSVVSFVGAANTSYSCSDVPPQPCPNNNAKLADMNPFSGPPINGTSWRNSDIAGGPKEFAVIGTPTIYKQIVTCPPQAPPTPPLPTPVTTAYDPPCTPPQWFSFAEGTNGYGAWKVLRLPIGAPPGSSDPEWQQMPSRSAPNRKITNCVYMGSVGDYRDVNPNNSYLGPKYIYLTRSSAEYGIVAVNGPQFASDFVNSPNIRGDIVEVPSADQREILTLHEIATSAPESPPASTRRRARAGFVIGSQSFGFTPPGEDTIPFLAVACGFILEDKDVVPGADPLDPFEGYELQSRAIIYHVADPLPPEASNAPPMLTPRIMLLRTATPNYTPLDDTHRSTAMSIRVKRLCDPLDEGRFSTFAFVADFNGNLFVYKLTAADLMDPTSPRGFPNGVPTPATALTPLVQLDLGINVFDGERHNITAMEIVGNHAYLACARLGVVVVDLSSPTQPAVLSMTGWPTNYPQGVLETPGVATGLGVRTIGNTPTLVVADTRGGYRLYGRP